MVTVQLLFASLTLMASAAGLKIDVYFARSLIHDVSQV